MSSGSTKILMTRNTTAVRESLTLDAGQPFWDTDHKRLYIGDGETAGGLSVTDAHDEFGTRIFAFDDSESYALRSYDLSGNLCGTWYSSGALDLNVYIKCGTYLRVGNPVNPSGSHLSFNADGTINALYGLFSMDCHALGGVYGSAGVVVGAGRQDHTHDGSLWIASQGVDSQGGGEGQGAPKPGSQETRVYTDESGTHFQNNHALAEQGSTSSQFSFDDTIQAAGYKSSDGTAGFTGSIPAGAALTVKNGLITGYTEP